MKTQNVKFAACLVALVWVETFDLTLALAQTPPTRSVMSTYNAQTIVTNNQKNIGPPQFNYLFDMIIRGMASQSDANSFSKLQTFNGGIAVSGPLSFVGPMTTPNTIYMAACTGNAAADWAAWQTAYAAAAAATPSKIELPANQSCNFGANTAVILASNMTVEGPGSTILSAASTGIQIGNAVTTATHVTLSGFVVAGNTGSSPSTSSIGIDWNNFGYGVENNVTVHDFGILRNAQNSASLNYVSIALNISQPFGYNATSTMLQFANVAGAHVTQPQFGRNGGDTYASPCMVTVAGQANGNEIDGGDIIPQGPSASSTTNLICYIGAVNANNILWLKGVNSENYLHAVYSDSSTTSIDSLQIVGGRYGSVSGDFFSLGASTILTNFLLTGANIGGSMTIPASATVSLSVLSGNFIGGQLSVAGACPPGGGTLTLQTGHYNCVGGTNTASDILISGGSVGSIALSGTFQNLTFNSTLQGGSYSDSSWCNYSHYCKNIQASGSYTPTLACASGSATVSAASGVWEITHNNFVADASVQLSSVGSCSGALTLGGLPFTIKNNFGGGVTNSYGNMAGIGSLIYSPVGATGNYSLNNGSATGMSPLTASNLTATSYVGARLFGSFQ